MSESHPIFIIGVPRSGTTLLRVILDSHSKLAAASETPWILGGYGENSIRHLAEFLITNDYGPVKNITGVDRKTVMNSIRIFLNEIMTPLLTTTGKKMLVLKTPDDIKYLEFLLELYPEAKYLHIFRDGRDAACSIVENKSALFGKTINDYGELNHLNAIRRWYDWELKVRNVFAESNVDYFRIKYEDFVVNHVTILHDVCNFIGIEFEPDMLNYGTFKHDAPSWEAGSYDLRKKSKIDDSSIGKWRNCFSKNELSTVQDMYGSFLKELGYE